MSKLRVSIAGASGYAGGELLRLLLFHPEVEVQQVTSERFAGKPITRTHPNLRQQTRLVFSRLDDLTECDLLFLALPHGKAQQNIDHYRSLAPCLIDLSADFRLNNKGHYQDWYGKEHQRPDCLESFIYGIPELHREAMKETSTISSAGCNATATILGLHPLFQAGVVKLDCLVTEVKVGSSEGGNASSEASHHPERSGCVRSFMPTGHRHQAEILQELPGIEKGKVHFSATSIDMIRGVLATSHVFLKENLADKDIWRIYREAYGNEPFIRIVNERQGIYRLPEPKLLVGTNFCDIGFRRDEQSNRVVIVSAIDNLMKGAAGQAVQAMNIMKGYAETEGLTFPGLHPV